MKKALIITYYWPPSGGAGVQRWLKMVKYMRDFGWEPVIYTPDNPESPVTDNSLVKDVPEGIAILKTRIREPYFLYKWLKGQKKSDKINAAFLTEKAKPGYGEKIFVWIRGNLFIPDARVLWVKPSVKFLSHYLSTNPVDVIVSTGPPHSMHLIALGLKRKMNIPWVADFRDPWTEIDFYSKLMLTPRADNKHKRLEKEVLANAEAVTCVGKTWTEGLRKIEAVTPNKFYVIQNGYDPEDFEGNKEVILDTKFTLAHIGTLDKSRNAPFLWKVLSELVKTDACFAKDLEIKLVGKVDINVKRDIENNGLSNNVNYISYLPHNEVLRVQRQSQVLLLLINNTPNAMGINTGKFYEYLASMRPILCVGPKGGDADITLQNTKGGMLAGFDDVVKIKEIINKFFTMYRNHSLQFEGIYIEKYSRKREAGEMAEVFNRIL